MKKLLIFIIAFIVMLFIFSSCTQEIPTEIPTNVEETAAEVVQTESAAAAESVQTEETLESLSETWTYTNPYDKSTEGVTEMTFIDFITQSEETTEPSTEEKAQSAIDLITSQMGQGVKCPVCHKIFIVTNETHYVVSEGIVCSSECFSNYQTGNVSQEPIEEEPTEFVPHQKQIERTYRILMKAFITRDKDIVLNTIANNKDIFLYIITHRTSYTDEQSPFGYIYYPGQFEEGSFKNVIHCNSYVSNGTDIDFYGITVENVEVDGHNELHVIDNHHQYHIYICGPVDEEPFTIEEATIYIKYTHYTYTEISWGPDGDGYCHLSSVPTYHINNEEILRISYTDLIQLEATAE